MKKFLQKSSAWLVMLVAMFAMSMSAWAQEQSVTFSFYLKESPQTLNGITLEYYGYNNTFEGYEEYATAELYGNARVMTVSTDDNFIKRVELNRTTFYGPSYDWRQFSASVGNTSVSQYDATAYWTAPNNETQSVTFTSRDVYLSSVTVYYVPAEMDDVTYTIDFDGDVPAGCSVTLDGRTYTADATYTIDKKFSLNSLEVTAALGWEAETSYDEPSHTFTIKFKEKAINWAVFSGTDPVAGTVSLDDLSDGLSSIRVNTDTWIAEQVYYTAENGKLADGFTITDSENNSYPIQRIEGWAPYEEWWSGQMKGYEFFYVYLDEPIKTPGTYTLNIPANAVPMYGDKVSPAATYQWTLTAPEHFDFGYNFYTANGEKMPSGNLKTLTGFTLNAPEGVTLTGVATDAAILARNKETYEYDVPVDAAIVLNADNTISVTFEEPYTVPGSYGFRLAEGSILAGSLTSKQANFSASVNPYNGQFNVSNKTPAYGAEVAGPVKTISFDIPEGKAVKTTGNTISINNEDVEVTVTVEGTTVTINLPEENPFYTGENNHYSIPEYFVVTEDDYANYYTDAWNITITAPAKVTAVYPTPGEIRLDDDEYGLRSIRLVFEGGFDKAVFAGEGNPVPDGVTLTKDGTTPITINPSYGFTMWQGDTECYVNTTPSSLVEPGTYVLHIPAGINTIGGRPTEEVNVTWTVVAASTFTVEDHDVEALGEKWDNTYMKTLTGLSVTLPSDATFKEFSAEKAVELRGQNDEYSPVAATWAENDGVVTITFDTPVTGVDANLNYRIAEGSIVLTDGRYNKAVTKSVSVSKVFVFNATSTTPQNWTNLGNNQLDENFEFTFVYPVEIDDVNITKFAFTQPAIQLSTSVVDYKVNGNTLTFKFKKAWLDANYDSTFGTMNDWSNVYLHVAEMAVLDAELNYNQEASYMYYWRVYPTFTMGDGEWCTYSSSSCFVVPAGYTAYYVSGFEGESVVLKKIGDAGKTLYYYNGYLLNGPAGKVAYETGNYWDALSPNVNYLVSNPDYTNTYYASNIAGAYWDYQIDTPIESCKLYQLSYDNNGENLGFYTQTGTNGESIEVAADKAFLFVPERAAGSIKRFVLEDGTVVTGLTAIEVPMEKDAIYNLQGQRVNTAKNGVFVKNGKKFIVK